MTALSVRPGITATLPLDVLLGMIPSLPRAALDRLTQRMIDRLDEIDGDPDLEDDGEDCCPAGDDDVRSGLSPSHQRLRFPVGWIGDEVDAETLTWGP